MDPLASCNDTRHIEMFSEFCLEHPGEKQCFPEQMQDMSTPAGYDNFVSGISKVGYKIFIIFEFKLIYKRKNFIICEMEC